MIRRWGKIGALAALVAALVAPAAVAQFGGNTLTINSAASGSNPSIRAEGLDTNISISIVPKGTGTLSLGSAGFSTTGAGTFGSLTSTGALTVGTPVSKTYFIRAVDHCRPDTTTMVVVRIAEGDWALARTAGGAETHRITCNVPLGLIATANKGVRLDSFSIAQQITVVNLTSNTFDGLNQTVYANNVANAVSDYGGVITITPPTVVQANPYLTAGTIGTPAFLNPGTNASIAFEWTVVMANTGVYRVYGVAINYSEAQY
jgi:hypothetical protein